MFTVNDGIEWVGIALIAGIASTGVYYGILELITKSFLKDDPYSTGATLDHFKKVLLK